MDDLKLIKKYYGENMMHLCRELFPNIINSGKLFSIIDSSFARSKSLYNDIITEYKKDEFKYYIYSLYNPNKQDIKNIRKRPFELLDKAGYVLYECKTEQEIQKFKKYYEWDEELCTFNGGRLDSCYVFFAVKKDVDKIKREKFKNPKREDEYSTSVLSIQFSKGSVNTISIKSRYNHHVTNPDSTYANNLDMIVEGLTDSFAKYYNLKFDYKSDVYFELNNYVQANDGKYYKFNYEIDNIYYCTNNLIINNRTVNDKYSHENTARYLFMDYFILDLKEKKFIDTIIEDSFLDYFKNSNGIKNINIRKNGNFKNVIITLLNKENKEESVTIVIDSDGKIIRYENNYLEEIGDNFLYRNTSLKELSLPNVKKVEDDFLRSNTELHEINIGNVESIGNSFLMNNNKLSKISFLKLKRIGNRFLDRNTIIDECNIPYLESVGLNFLSLNDTLEKIEFLHLKDIGECFLEHNKKVKIVNLPSAENIGDYFLLDNQCVDSIYLPSAKNIGNSFFYKNRIIKKVNLPNAVSIGDYFLGLNKELQSLSLENTEVIGNDFMSNNEILHSIFIPKVKDIGDNFLPKNIELESISFPNLISVGDYFMSNSKKTIYKFEKFPFESTIKLEEIIEQIYSGTLDKKNWNFYLNPNKKLSNVYLPNLKKLGKCFLADNQKIKIISLPSANFIDHGFMLENNTIEVVDLPNVTELGNCFLLNNNKLRKLVLKHVKYIPRCFIYSNNCLESIDLSRAEIIDDYFLYLNNSLECVNFPLVKRCCNHFMNKNNSLKKLYMPSVERIGTYFLPSNKCLEYADFSNLKWVEGMFLCSNKKLFGKFNLEAGNIHNLFVNNKLLRGITLTSIMPIKKMLFILENNIDFKQKISKIRK